MMDSPKDQSYNEWLVINSKTGDSAALNELLSRWQPRLFAYALRRLGDREAAKDVVQECLLSVTKSIRRLNDPGAFPKWCYTLLDRRCADYFRASSKLNKKVTSVPAEELNKFADLSASNETLEDQLTVEQALGQLDAELAMLLKLYYQESFSILEIAEITRVPQGTVKSRLFYARKLLATLMEK
jgi:RNA polymerase sigma-70 factor (ECF subfamily)